MSMLNINIEELLKELDPATLQALEQLLAEDAPAVRKLFRTYWMNLFLRKWRRV